MWITIAMAVCAATSSYRARSNEWRANNIMMRTARRVVSAQNSMVARPMMSWPEVTKG